MPRTQNQETTMSWSDYSTRKLKREYIRCLKTTWRLRPHRRDGFSSDIGLSKDYWAYLKAAEMIRDILTKRGTDMP